MNVKLDEKKEFTIDSLTKEEFYLLIETFESLSKYTSNGLISEFKNKLCNAYEKFKES